MIMPRSLTPRLTLSRIGRAAMPSLNSTTASAEDAVASEGLAAMATPAERESTSGVQSALCEDAKPYHRWLPAQTMNPHQAFSLPFVKLPGQIADDCQHRPQSSQQNAQKNVHWTGHLRLHISGTRMIALDPLHYSDAECMWKKKRGMNSELQNQAK